MTDPIQPFKDAYKTAQADFQAALGSNKFMQGWRGVYAAWPSQGEGNTVALKQRMDVAFRAWKIAERDGVDAAIMWKLANNA